MNRTLLISIIALVIACGVVSFFVFSSSTEISTTPPTPQPLAKNAPDTPIPQSAIGKDVRGDILFSRKFFQPSNITVGRNDVVNLYVTAIDNNLTLFVPSTGTTVQFERGIAQRVALQATSDVTIVCTNGCEPGVSFTVHTN